MPVTTNGSHAPAPQVAIIGAGMSGMCMAMRLHREGIETFTIFEKAGEVGGTWRENRYPGLSCDVPSPFYSYSFAPNADWSTRFSDGAEIQAYFKGVAQRAGVLDRVRYDTEIVDAAFDGDRWRLRSAAGEEFTADVVVAATGVLHQPRIPDIPGLETFAGAAFHSARWDESVPLDGRRIAVIGTGSTGVQIVTALSTRAAKVTQFQRSAQWIAPVPNYTYSRAWRGLLHRFPRLNELRYRGTAMQYGLFTTAVVRPGWQRSLIQAVCRLNLHTIRDRDLRRRMTPDYEPMCRRLIMSSGYYRAIQRPTVEVVDAGIDHVEPRGIVTADGRLHECDVIALATGFDAHAFVRPMTVTGRDGLTLDEAWAPGPRAHRTVTVPGFPNLFLMLGPNSPIGNTSLVPLAESQADFVARWVRRIASGEIHDVAPTAEATAAFNAAIRDNMRDTVWVTGCDSWYIGPDGQPTMWPFAIDEFHRMMAATPDDREYEITRAPAPAVTVA